MRFTKILLFFLACFFYTQANSQIQTPVFISGTEGHVTYRIPAIVVLPNHTLLAFAEGRVKGSNDFGDINIVLKRSKDNGKTWSSIQTIVDYGNLQAGNCAPVLDNLDPRYPGGRLFLFYNTGNVSEWDIRKGKGQREVWYISSVDGGITWSLPTNITSQVKPEGKDWRAYANTPGHAFQIPTGKYKGRILIPANHSEGEPQNNYTDYYSHAFYSDDHGDHFNVGEKLPFAGSNEATATYLTNDRIMLNARNQMGNPRARIIGISKDGGQHWDSVYIDNQLPDPVCEATILTVGIKNKKSILAFCNPADTQQRNKLTLRLSDSEGATWNKFWTIDSTQDKKSDYTAYCDIAMLKKNKLGILFEKDNYKKIVFTQINLKKNFSNK